MKAKTTRRLGPQDKARDAARLTWGAWDALQRRAATMIKSCDTPAGLLALARVLVLVEEMRSSAFFAVRHLDDDEAVELGAPAAVCSPRPRETECAGGR